MGDLKFADKTTNSLSVPNINFMCNLRLLRNRNGLNRLVLLWCPLNCSECYSAVRRTRRKNSDDIDCKNVIILDEKDVRTFTVI